MNITRTHKIVLSQLATKKKQNAYTLVEVIVAVTIMSTLTAVGLQIRSEQIEAIEQKAEEVAIKSLEHNTKTMQAYEQLFSN